MYSPEDYQKIYFEEKKAALAHDAGGRFFSMYLQNIIRGGHLRMIGREKIQDLLRLIELQTFEGDVLCELLKLPFPIEIWSETFSKVDQKPNDKWNEIRTKSAEIRNYFINEYLYLGNLIKRTKFASNAQFLFDDSDGATCIAILRGICTFDASIEGGNLKSHIEGHINKEFSMVSNCSDSGRSYQEQRDKARGQEKSPKKKFQLISSDREIVSQVTHIGIGNFSDLNESDGLCNENIVDPEEFSNAHKACDSLNNSTDRMELALKIRSIILESKDDLIRGLMGNQSSFLVDYAPEIEPLTLSEALNKMTDLSAIRLLKEIE